MRIDISLVYWSYPVDRINTQEINVFYVSGNIVNGTWRHCRSWLVGQYMFFVGGQQNKLFNLVTLNIYASSG